MYLILLWKWLLGWTHNWEEVNSSSWWKKVQVQGRNIAAVDAMEQPCCKVMMRPFTEHHSLPPYPGPLWQAKNVKVQEKEHLHTLNCPDKTVIAYDSFCPINLEQKWKYTECHLPHVLRITAILHECGWRKQLFSFLPGKMPGNPTEVIPPSLVPFTDLEHELDLNYIFSFP